MGILDMAAAAALDDLDAAPAGRPAVELVTVGIDPGKQGWAVELDGRGRFVRATPVPMQADGSEYDQAGLLALARSWAGRVDYALLETAAPFRDQGGLGNFSCGFGYGLWQMALTAAGIPRRTVPPAAWKRAMGLLAEPVRMAREDRQALEAARQRRKHDPEARALVALHEKARRGKKKVAKSRACAHAQALFPGVDLRRTPRCQGPDDGKAEALLLAAFAQGRGHVG